MARFFTRLVSTIREKLASRESFATVYATLLFVSGYLLNIDFRLFRLDPSYGFITKYDVSI